MTVTGHPDSRQPQVDERMGRAIQALLVVAAVLATAGVALGEQGHLLEWGAVLILLALPLLRVAWLALLWARQRDWRFAALASLLLILAAVGPITALLQR